MNDVLESLTPTLVVLSVPAVIALFLSLARGWANEQRARTAAPLAVVTIVVQAAHFTEELSTGFHGRFPALFGLPPISSGVFVSFNLAWLGIWSLSVWGLLARRRAALFPLWFLAIACLVNGVAHPGVSIVIGGYFPGLVSSPAAGVLGVLLLSRLFSATQSAGSQLDTE